MGGITEIDYGESSNRNDSGTSLCSIPAQHVSVDDGTCFPTGTDARHLLLILLPVTFTLPHGSQVFASALPSDFKYFKNGIPKSPDVR